MTDKLPLKIGSKGSLVKELQTMLGISADGDFGPKTDAAVRNWQSQNNLVSDGIVGNKTWSALTSRGSISEKYYLPPSEYYNGPIKFDYLFLHHTAGWHNPYRVVDDWKARNSKTQRGKIGTEFVIGGQSVKGNDTSHDGKIISAFPKGNYLWHLGKNGSQYMHKNSVGIEVCNFGYIVNGKTYANTSVVDSQIATLSQPFRGYKTWHRYSDAQIESLRKLILHLADTRNIDVRKGLPELIKQKGADAFEFNEDAYYGKIRGCWSHTNTRKDKTDMFPQQELMDMLVSL